MDLFLTLQHFLDASATWCEIAALPSGCIGFCEQAPVVANIAKGKLYREVSLEDIRQIAEEAMRIDRKSEWTYKV